MDETTPQPRSKRDVRKDFERLQKAVQRALLNSNPNPERIGCPGSSALREVAAGIRSPDDPTTDHLTECSPCYRDFLAIQAALRSHRKKNIRVAAAVLAVSVGMAFFGFYWIGTKRSAPGLSLAKPTVAAILNLDSLSGTRGEDERRTGDDLQHVPRARVTLYLYLPIGSEPGVYDVRLLRSKDDKMPLAHFSGVAAIERGLPVIQISADFSSLEPGVYTVGIRSAGLPWGYQRFILS